MRKEEGRAEKEGARSKRLLLQKERISKVQNIRNELEEDRYDKLHTKGLRQHPHKGGATGYRATPPSMHRTSWSDNFNPSVEGGIDRLVLSGHHFHSPSWSRLMVKHQPTESHAVCSRLSLHLPTFSTKPLPHGGGGPLVHSPRSPQFLVPVPLKELCHNLGFLSLIEVCQILVFQWASPPTPDLPVLPPPGQLGEKGGRLIRRRLALKI